MFERIKAIVHNQYPLKPGMCQMERTRIINIRQLRIKKLMGELLDLSAEQQLFIVKKWEDEK